MCSPNIPSGLLASKDFSLSYFIGSLMGAIIKNMQGYLKSDSKKMYIYSAVSNLIFIYLYFTWNDSI